MLCASALTPFSAGAQDYYENFALRGEIAAPSFDLSAFIGLPDEAYIREIRRLQHMHPSAAYWLAEEAMRQRPHLSQFLSYRGPAQAPVEAYREPTETYERLVDQDSNVEDLAIAAGGLALVGGVAAFLATSSGEGGSGSGGGGVTVTVQTTLPAVPPGWEEDVADWDDAEYGADHSKGMINASSAYARAGTGTGINVGVIDGGIDPAHGEFAGRIGGCFDLDSGAPSACIDPDAHGTHVAGSIGAARDGSGMHGVAFDAELYSIRAFESGPAGAPVGDGSTYQSAISWAAANDVAVINNSYGNDPHDTVPWDIHDYVDDYYGEGLERARDNDIIMVWATGNDGDSEPSVESALPLYDPSLRDLWVAVTSVDADGSRSDYANACGAAAAWCIAAPGGNTGEAIASTVPGGGYGGMAGTSMAAPQVTGAVAIMLQLFGPGTASNLSPQEIVKVLFATADKSLPGFVANAAGVSEIYGNGLLDLDAATTPSTHNLRFRAANGTFASMMSSGITSGTGFGAGMRAALAGKKLAVFDDLNRAVVVDLEKFAKSAGEPIDLDRALSNFGQGNGFQNVVTEGGLKLALRGSFSEEDGGVSLGGDGQARLSVELSDTMSLESGYNTDASQMLGMYASGAIAPELLIDPAALSSSYLALAESAMTAGIRRSGANGDFSVMAFSGTDYRPEETELDIRLSGEDEKNWTYGVAAEWTTRPTEAFSLALRSGAMVEADELLGAEMEGGFEVTQTETAFAGASVSYDLAKNLKAVAAYDIGVSAVAADDSVFSDFGTVLSDSFSFGLFGKGGFQEKDQYGLIVSQPLRVFSSEAEMELAQSRNSDGSLNYSTEGVDLAPEDRELRLQGFYAAAMGEGTLSLAGLVRFNPGHDADAETEWAALAAYQAGF